MPNHFPSLTVLFPKFGTKLKKLKITQFCTSIVLINMCDIKIIYDFNDNV